jgi:hypothetical protein
MPAPTKHHSVGHSKPRVSVAIYDPVTDWKVQLTAAQQCEKGSYHISLVWEKMKIQNLKYGFYQAHVTFTPL